MKRKDYLEYVEKAVVAGRKTYEESIESWKTNFDADYMFGYTSPGIIASQIHMEGLLYSLKGNRDHAEFIRDGLRLPMELAAIFPEEIRLQRKEYYRGVPLLEALFQLHAYMNAYLDVKDSGILTDEDVAVVRQSVIQSVTPLIFCPEWGAHNRSMLRACALVQGAAVVGDTEETREWIKLADYLAEESIGGWSLEDAVHYIPLWLFACIMYAQWRGIEDEYYKKPQTKYYFDYITRLITDEGQIPGFGDAWFHSNWYIWVACIEKGAAMYKCGEMKEAADRIFKYGVEKLHAEPSPGLGNYMAYAYKWSSDEVEQCATAYKSGEVLEELVGKKIVLRGGGSYMLYNYRDEGMYGFIPRQYLRTSIPVKAEKMHHGHGDENSISHLEKNGNILLHEGGYRERLPNGKYRADLYHNRLVFREGLKDLSNGNFNALHDDGYYKHAETEKIHFQRFEGVEYLRTRNRYRSIGITWDRCVAWLREDDAYIVVDWVENETASDITIGNVWHTQKARETGGHSYLTWVDTMMRGQNDRTPFENKKDLALAIEFISEGTTSCADEIRRNYADSTMVSECAACSFDKGGRKVFITVLTPHRRDLDASGIMGRVKVEKDFAGKEAVSLVYNGTSSIHMVFKLDLEFGLHPYIEDRAPAYDWETGKIDYGHVMTDADFVFVSESSGKLNYGMVNGCRVLFKGETLFEAPRYSSRDFLMETFREIDHKWRAWSGEKSK
ncbi:MAG: hypothetical protein R6W99_02325 [Clostridia bacterium]